MTDMPDTIYAWVWDLPYPTIHQGRADWSSITLPKEQRVEVYVKKSVVMQLLAHCDWSEVPDDLWQTLFKDVISE